jgi:hypothetical protein
VNFTRQVEAIRPACHSPLDQASTIIPVAVNGDRLTKKECIMKQLTKSGAAMAAAALALAVSGTVLTSATANAEAGSIYVCVGANACKGQSECKTANSSCRGQNACKGQGVRLISKIECDKAGGTALGAN